MSWTTIDKWPRIPPQFLVGVGFDVDTDALKVIERSMIHEGDFTNLKVEVDKVQAKVTIPPDWGLGYNIAPYSMGNHPEFCVNGNTLYIKSQAIDIGVVALAGAFMTRGKNFSSSNTDIQRMELSQGDNMFASEGLGLKTARPINIVFITPEESEQRERFYPYWQPFPDNTQYLLDMLGAANSAKFDTQSEALDELNWQRVQTSMSILPDEQGTQVNFAGFSRDELLTDVELQSNQSFMAPVLVAKGQASMRWQDGYNNEIQESVHDHTLRCLVICSDLVANDPFFRALVDNGLIDVSILEEMLKFHDQGEPNNGGVGDISVTHELRAQIKGMADRLDTIILQRLTENGILPEHALSLIKMFNGEENISLFGQSYLIESALARFIDGLAGRSVLADFRKGQLCSPQEIQIAENRIIRHINTALRLASERMEIDPNILAGVYDSNTRLIF